MTTNLARATKVIDRTAEKVGTRAPLLAQALKRAHLLVPDAPNPVEYGMTIDGGGTRVDQVSVSLLRDSVALVVIDEHGGARVLLSTDEAHELGGWLLAAATSLTAKES